MNTSFVQKCQVHVEQFLTEKLSAQYLYHDLGHTLVVKDYCQLLGTQSHLDPLELEILLIAALFHDTGFTETYEGHEEASQHIAQTFLTHHNYPDASINSVLACIAATKMEAVPKTLLEKLIKDADLNSLGTDAFFTNSNNLRTEWATLCDETYTDLEWYQNNIDFLEKHQYFTPAAKAIFDTTKQSNLKKIKKMSKKELGKTPKTSQSEKKTSKKEKKKKKTDATIAGSRSAQMMFKTSLRNHIDLTNIADNKANILLTISTGVLTFGLPIATSYLSSSPYLIFPTIILMLTCLLTIIFATLATRPIKMNGFSSPELLSQGKTNLFFFGNFYKMNLKDYQSNLKIIIGNEDYLEDIIISDLFYLGKALGEKYARLRVCYLIFMIGITATVITYVITYMSHIKAGL